MHYLFNISYKNIENKPITLSDISDRNIKGADWLKYEDNNPRVYAGPVVTGGAAMTEPASASRALCNISMTCFKYSFKSRSHKVL